MNMDRSNNRLKAYLHAYLDEFGVHSLTANAYVQWSELPLSVKALWDDGFSGYVTIDLQDGTIHHGEVPVELMTYFNQPIEDIHDEF